MAYVLRDLVGAEKTSFDVFVDVCEKKPGKTGISAKLMGDINSRDVELLKNLGLDAMDTTGEELYFALQNRFAEDSDVAMANLSLLGNYDITEKMWENVRRDFFASMNVGRVKCDFAATKVVEFVNDLANRDVRFVFWKNNLETGIILGNELVSANIYDVMMDFNLRSTFRDRHYSVFQDVLLNDLISKYQEG